MFDFEQHLSELGTQTVLETAAACGAESFVNISTDKAADPVSILGATKRIAEMVVQSIGPSTAHVEASGPTPNVARSVWAPASSCGWTSPPSPALAR